MILPKGIGLDKAQKKIEYFSNPQTSRDGRKIIGKISYTYQNKVVGEADIYFKDSGLPTLNDSINMSEWFDDAVEKINKKPFPWKKTILLSILVMAIGLLLFYLFQRIRSEREIRSRRNRHKRTNRRQRRAERGMYINRK